MAENEQPRVSLVGERSHEPPHESAERPDAAGAEHFEEREGGEAHPGGVGSGGADVDLDSPPHSTNL